MAKRMKSSKGEKKSGPRAIKIRKEAVQSGRGARPGADVVGKGRKAVHARVWIEAKGEAWLNASRIKLLEGIQANGSIAAAAREMGLSYAHAWKLVESMNATRPALVGKISGGQRGGGARLTAAGEKAIDFYYETIKELEGFVAGIQKKMDRVLK